MRIDRLLSNLKYGTRNEIKKIINDGLVCVNDKQIHDSAFHVFDKDKITINDELVYHKEVVSLILNKPKGYVCANRDELNKTVLDLIKEPYNRFDLDIAGRLDIDTEGLVILTTSGNLLHRIISPNKKVFKKYYVEFEGVLKKDELENGLVIKDGKNNDYLTEKAYVEELTSNSCYIKICEGKFHQVKRMFEKTGAKVIYLKRLEIGEISLDGLELGEYKEIELERYL